MTVPARKSTAGDVQSEAEVVIDGAAIDAVGDGFSSGVAFAVCISLQTLPLLREKRKEALALAWFWPGFRQLAKRS